MSSEPKVFDLPKPRPEVLTFLKDRRSNLAKVMLGDGKGPSEAEIEDLLTIAARVPDHRKLSPWRFLLFQGEARAHFGQHIATAFMKQNPDAPHDRAIFEGQRFLRAPLVIGVVSSPVDCPRGTPKWEQILSSGAVCYNLCLAAQSMGYGAQWLTEWYAYDADVQNALGLSENEEVSGFIYIGPVETPPTERARPEISSLSQSWSG